MNDGKQEAKLMILRVPRDSLMELYEMTGWERVSTRVVLKNWRGLRTAIKWRFWGLFGLYSPSLRIFLDDRYKDFTELEVTYRLWEKGNSE